MSWMKALENYARTFPKNIPKEELLAFTDDTITIVDGYDKAMYHYLVMPRLPSKLVTNPSRLSSLSSLLSGDKAEATRVMKAVREGAELAKSHIEEDMLRKHGFKWSVWMGFHAVPSMLHLHLHVISSDLISPRLKNKKHYNSFHPTLGFFLHLNDVELWLAEEKLANKLKINAAKYEALLKTDLSCYKCDEPFKQLPKLKEHLELEWKKEKSRATQHASKKRERGTDDGNDELAKKQKHVGTSENPPSAAPSSGVVEGD